MWIAIAVSVLLVLLPAPFDCRRLAAPAVTDPVDQLEPVVSTERVDLLDSNETEPVGSLDYEQIPQSNTDRSGYGFSFIKYKQKKNHNNKKIHDDNGKVWTKFHNKKNLVEIVPLENNLTLNKTLAYILPKINKKSRIIEGFIREQKPDFSDSSEANYSSEQKDAISSHSSSSESNSDEQIGYNQKFRPSYVHHAEINHKRVTKQRVNFTDTINEKIHDLLWYIKSHGDNDNLVHEFSVEKDESPNYHVHYIAHKKKQPTKQVDVEHKLSEHVIHNYNNKISIPQTQEEYYDNANENGIINHDDRNSDDQISEIYDHNDDDLSVDFNEFSPEHEISEISEQLVTERNEKLHHHHHNHNGIINHDDKNSDDQISEIYDHNDDELGVDLNEFSPEHETSEISEQLVTERNEKLHHHHHNHHVPHITDQEPIHTLQEKEKNNDILYEIEHDPKLHGLLKFIHNHEHAQHHHDGHQNELEEQDKLTSEESIDNNVHKYDTIEVDSINSDQSDINTVESEEHNLSNNEITNIQDNILEKHNYEFRDGIIEPTSEYVASNSESMNEDFSSINKDDIPDIKLLESASSPEISSSISELGTRSDEYIIKKLSGSEESHSDNPDHAYLFDDLEETQKRANDDTTAEELLLNEDHGSPFGLFHHHSHEASNKNILERDAKKIKECCESKKRKHLHDCLRHRSYKLTFLFNR